MNINSNARILVYLMTRETFASPEHGQIAQPKLPVAALCAHCCADEVKTFEYFASLETDKVPRRLDSPVLANHSRLVELRATLEQCKV